MPGAQIYYSDILAEYLAALKWRIPLSEWFEMDRPLRAAHIAAVEAQSAIDAYIALQSTS